MANENKFFVDSETEVTAHSVRNPDGDLLDGTATLEGAINGVKNIAFTYDGADGDFTCTVPRHCKFKDGVEYVLMVRVRQADGFQWSFGIRRRAELVEA